MIYTQKKVEKAIEYFDHIIEQHPQDDAAYATKSNALNQLASDTKKWDYTREALKCAEKAININPRNDTALFNKDWSLCDLGKPKEALEYADEALEVDPKNVYSLYNKAWAYYLLHEIEKALKCCDKILEIDPRFTNWVEDLKRRIEHREFPEHLTKFKR